MVSVFFSLSVFFFFKEFLGLVARGLKDFFFGFGGVFFFFYRGFYCIFSLGGGGLKDLGWFLYFFHLVFFFF